MIEEGIAFERHEEGGEVMFGVAKTSFAEALRANHLGVRGIPFSFHSSQGLALGFACVHGSWCLASP